MTIRTKVFTHRPHVSFVRYLFCWLPVTSQWTENYETISCKMLSNSLNIYFINGDIHSWSCNNICHIDAANRIHYFPNWMIRLICKITPLVQKIHINSNIIRFYFKIIIAFFGWKWLHKLLSNDAKRTILLFVIRCRCRIRNITPFLYSLER